MNKDNKLIKQVLDNLQLVSEKKKVDGMRSVKKGADNNPKVTKMDFLPNKVLDKIAKNKKVNEGDTNRLVCPNCGTHNEEGIDKCKNCGHPYPSPKDGKEWKEVASESLESVLESFINLDEKRKKRKKGRKKKKKTDFDVGGQPQYRAGRSKKQISRQASLTRKYNAATTEKQRQKYRDMIDRSRAKERLSESLILDKESLEELINESIEAEKLAIMLEKIEELEEKKKRKKKKGGGLSAAVKKSLDKKADRRGLTRGSVYAEFRKGLAAYYSSGSRKGMSAHQWAHARVNSANPSKSWAVVKKRKGGKKKKKK